MIYMNTQIYLYNIHFNDHPRVTAVHEPYIQHSRDKLFVRYKKFW